MKIVPCYEEHDIFQYDIMCSLCGRWWPITVDKAKRLIADKLVKGSLCKLNKRDKKVLL